MSARRAARSPVAEDVVVTLKGQMPLGVREYTQAKVAAAAGVCGRPVLSARAVVHRSADPAVARQFLVEVTLDVAGTPVRAEGDGASAHEAVDAVVERLERRVTALVDRWEERSRWLSVVTPGEWRHGDVPAPRRPWHPRAADEREVVRRSPRTGGPQSLDEAAWELDVSDAQFVLFTDATSGRDVVLHRREDGRLGLAGAWPADELPAPVVAEPEPPRLEEEQARRRLEDGGEPFVFYVDAASSRGHVLYHRTDGHYGLVAP